MVTFTVIGQSNSMANSSFVENIASREGVALKSPVRLGASPSIIGPYFVTDGFFAGIDFCLLDLCVVDRFALINKSVNYYSITKWVEWIGHRARAEGCQPIFLLLPISHAIDEENTIIDLYRSIIRANSFFYLDAAPLVKETAKETDRSIDELYSDSLHPGDIIKKKIAGELCVFFERYQPFRRQAFNFVDRNFRVLEMGAYASPQDAVFYRNRLMSFNGIRLTGACSVELETGPIDCVHGVMVNAAKSFRNLVITGDTRFVKGTAMKPHRVDVEFEARLVPISSPIRDSKGKLILSLAKIGEAPMEPTMQGLDSDPYGPDVAEIGGILVEGNNPIMRSYMASVPQPGRNDVRLNIE
jgi:hypothetical protein